MHAFWFLASGITFVQVFVLGIKRIFTCSADLFGNDCHELYKIDRLKFQGHCTCSHMEYVEDNKEMVKFLDFN